MARAMAPVHDLRGVRPPATSRSSRVRDRCHGRVRAGARGCGDGRCDHQPRPHRPGTDPGVARCSVVEYGTTTRRRVLRQSVTSAAPATRHGKAGTLSIYFDYLELRHKVEIYNITGRAIDCPIDEVNKPRGTPTITIRVPPTEAEVDMLFAAWRDDLRTCRKFAPMARSFAAAQLMARIGVRINECRRLDLDDIKWHLGRFGKLHVRFGKGSRGRGPKQRLVPLINGADRDPAVVHQGSLGPFR